jgi:hypothetical protein
MRWAHTSAVLLALALTVFASSSCTGVVPQGPVRPGITSGKLGGIEAVGYVERSDSDGGAWVLYQTPTHASGSAQRKVVAFVRPASGQSFKDEIEGRYVWVAGRRSGSASGGPPTIIADALELAEEP